LAYTLLSCRELAKIIVNISKGNNERGDTNGSVRFFLIIKNNKKWGIGYEKQKLKKIMRNPFGFVFPVWVYRNTIGVQTSALETSNAQAAVTNERFKTTEDLVASLQEDLKTLDCLVLKHVDNNAFAKAGHIARLKTEEDLDTYVFENTDGSKTVYYMGKEVKYIAEDRSVKEKDITLVPTKTGYQTKQNNVGVELPSVPAVGKTCVYVPNADPVPSYQLPPLMAP